MDDLQNTGQGNKSDQAPCSLGRDDLSLWFGLSYASWLTVPRVMMEAMPDDWQRQMAKLLNEFDDMFPDQPDLGTRVQITENGKLVKTPKWLLEYRHPDLYQLQIMMGPVD